MTSDVFMPSVALRRHRTINTANVRIDSKRSAARNVRPGDIFGKTISFMLRVDRAGCALCDSDVTHTNDFYNYTFQRLLADE